MQQYDDLDAIHIVSHGNIGELSLGNTKLNQNTLDSYADNLISWRDSITDDGDILLYGCNVAANTVGKKFVEELSQYTAADVLASTDLTGSEDLEGDWDLEYATGDIEESLAFDVEIQSSYQHTLNEFFFGDIPIYDNGTYYPQLPADIRLDSNGNIINPDPDFGSLRGSTYYIRLDAAFDAPNVSLNEPVIDLPSGIGSSDVEFGDLRIDYIPSDLTLVDPLIEPDLSLFRFNKVENQPFSLNFDNGNFAFKPYPDYQYETANFNSLIFPFDASSLNFNPTNFEFTSVSINEIGPLNPNRDSISFKFDEGTFDFSSMTPRNSMAFDFESSAFDFYNIEADNMVRFGDHLSFDATAVTFRSNSITFDYRPQTLNFNPSVLAANANLYEHKLSKANFDAGVTVEQFNASDYRALDYAFVGDELFDPQYYSNNNVLPQGMNPFTDYNENGYRAGRNPNGLFFVDYYRETNTDVKDDGMDPLKHFVLYGNSEILNSRDPNPLFDSSYYNAKNPDVVKEGMNSLLHYIQFGWQESRINNPKGFDPNRDPSPFFDTSFYFDKHTDVRDASYTLDSANALQHSLEFGINGLYANENRITHPIFEFESQIVFNTFIDSDSEGFEAVQNEINNNEYGIEISRGENGKVSVLQAGVGGGTGNPIEEFIDGIIYSIYAVASFLIIEGGELIYEVAQGSNTLSHYSFSPGLGQTDNIFVSPEADEGEIIVERFPRGASSEFLENFTGEENIFYTPLEPLEDISSTNTTFPQRDEILDGLIDGTFIFPDEGESFPTFYTINTDPFAAVDTNIDLDLGTFRELKVAEITGGFKTVTPGRPKKDLVVRAANNPGIALQVDNVGPNNELILTGGPNKASADEIKKLENRMSTLKKVADSRGVEAQAYFAEGTPQAAIDVAIEQLGSADNVFTFEDVTPEDRSRLLQLKIIKNRIDF